MVPTNGIVLATTYPKGAVVTVKKCASWNPCKELIPASTKADFFNSNGQTIFSESGTVFLRLVNEKTGYIQYKGKGAKILKNIYWNTERYIVTSTKPGAVAKALPSATWMEF